MQSEAATQRPGKKMEQAHDTLWYQTGSNLSRKGAGSQGVGEHNWCAQRQYPHAAVEMDLGNGIIDGATPGDSIAEILGSPYSLRHFLASLPNTPSTSQDPAVVSQYSVAPTNVRMNG